MRPCHLDRHLSALSNSGRPVRLGGANMTEGDSMTEATLLLDDLIIGESPRWHDGRLWFCNWGARQIVAVGADGRSEVIPLDPAVDPHSIEWLPDGRLLVVAKGDEVQHRLLRQEHDGDVVLHADLGDLPAGLNEIVVDGRGNIYFNGIGFDFLTFMKSMDPADHRPLHERPGYAPGFIAVITPDGTVRRVGGDVAFPNGMAVTPDNRTLIVAESFARCLTAYDIEPDGGLSNRRVWAGDVGPDGICIDADGAVWTSTGGTTAIRVREGGEILDRVELDRWPFALMLGGDTLYIMAAHFNPMDPFGGPHTGQVLTAPAPARHVGWP